MELGENETLEDLLLDNLKIIQNKTLYRFTSDAVILSKFASSRKNDVVADFCSGSGIVGIHYYGLHKNVKSVTLFEMQKALSDMSLKSTLYNGINDIFKVENIKLQDIGSEYNGKFSLILCNPPYKKKNSGEQNLEEHIAVCRHEIEITLEEIVAIASKKLKDGGRFCICERIERFTDLICILRDCKLEPVKIQFVTMGENKSPYLVLTEAVKGVKPQLKVLPDFINK